MLEHQIFRQPGAGEAMILAVFSYRYDAHLVPDLVENIRPGVHGYVAWDDRNASQALSSEPARREALFQAARDLGADWLLLVDPDERLEHGFARWLPELIAQGPGIVWSFTVCEMFTPDRFRTDGPWGGKARVSFLAAAVAKADPQDLLHARPVDGNAGLRHKAARINFYHLRMATPARRQLRRDLYAAADPMRRFQVIGYDYLDDERGMVLERIPPGRDFNPPFVEDHGLWAPDPGHLGDLVPDPYEVRLTRASRSVQQRGHLAASHVMEDLAQDSPEDHDLTLAAARLALQAGAFDRAQTLAQIVAEMRPGDQAARLVLAEAALWTGDGQRVDAVLPGLGATVPDSPVLAALRAERQRDTADFRLPDAGWRQFAPPCARLHEGAAVARADLAVVVIGFRAQPGLRAAVQSLLDQDAVAEIVVVNSGGGPVLADLAPLADHIRLITCEAPLYVGAARQIGVAASRATYLAFLAGDCLARPGWVSGRLARHRAGAMAVSSAVVPQADAGLVAQAACWLHYAARHPQADPRHLSHYGMSYARRLLSSAGAFPPGLRTGEDTWLNRVVARQTGPVWAPDVATEHVEPGGLAALLRGDRGRGQRRAAHAPFRAQAAAADLAKAIAPVFASRLDVARALVMADPALGPRERVAILAMQWLAAQADRCGTVEGLADIAAAAAIAEAAKPCRPDKALRLLARARALDPQSPALAWQVEAAHLALGDTAGAEAALREGLAIEPADVPAARRLVKLVADRDGAGAAWVLAERLALSAPFRTGLWDLAAERAHAAGHLAWAVALGHTALATALELPWTHRRLGRWHVAAGDPVAAAFRDMTARRLQAATDRQSKAAEDARTTS